jgi:hypothetical protein
VISKECRRARSFLKHPEKQSDNSSAEFALSCPDREALLFQPHVAIQMKPGSMCHHHAIRMISQQVVNKAAKSTVDRERVGRVWAEFVLPFFGYPAHWVLDEARESFRGELNNYVVKCE